MENRDYDLRNIRRYLEFPLKIQRVGLRPNNVWVHRNNRPTAFFLSFVLQQEQPEVITVIDGCLVRRMHTPRMGVTSPGTLLNSVKSSCLNEIFFSYEPEARTEFDRFGLHDCDFSFTRNFNGVLERIKLTLSELQCPGAADRLDQLAIELAGEAMISSLEKQPEKMSVPDERIFQIANYFQFHFRQKIDLPGVLKKHGMTPRTFYREWNKYYTVSPAQFLIGLRLDQACTLLLDPTVKIYEAADRCGFCDPMYFNRCFSRHYGMTPREYRKKHSG